MSILRFTKAINKCSLNRRMSDERKSSKFNKALFLGTSVLLSSAIGYGYYYFRKYNEKPQLVFENEDGSLKITDGRPTNTPNKIIELKEDKELFNKENKMDIQINSMKNDVISSHVLSVAKEAPNEVISPSTNSTTINNNAQIVPEIQNGDDLEIEIDHLHKILSETTNLSDKLLDIQRDFNDKLQKLNKTYQECFNKSIFDIKGFDNLLQSDNIESLNNLFNGYIRLKESLQLANQLLFTAKQQFECSLKAKNNKHSSEVADLFEKCDSCVAFTKNLLNSKESPYIDSLIENARYLNLYKDQMMEKSEDILTPILLVKKISHLNSLIVGLLADNNEKTELLNKKTFELENGLKNANLRCLDELIDAHSHNLKKQHDLLRENFEDKLENEKQRLIEHLNHFHINEFGELSKKFESFENSYIAINKRLEEQKAQQNLVFEITQFYLLIFNEKGSISGSKIIANLNSIIKSTNGTKMEPIISSVCNSIPAHLLSSSEIKTKDSLVMDLVSLTNQSTALALVKPNPTIWQYIISFITNKLRIKTLDFNNKYDDDDDTEDSVDVNNPYEIIEKALYYGRNNQLGKSIGLLRLLETNSPASKVYEQWIGESIRYLELQFLAQFMLLSIKNRLYS